MVNMGDSPFIRKYVEHHIKYVETHGYDETEIITTSEHQLINHRNLFPMVTSEELAKISRDAHKRTRKYKDSLYERFIQEQYQIPSEEHMAEIARTKPIL